MLELLVTLAISVILVTLAAPSLTQFLQKQAVDAMAQSLMGDLRMARSEAIKRGVQVKLCGLVSTPNSTGTSTTYSCAAAPLANAKAAWGSSGWLVLETANSTAIKIQQPSMGVGAINSSEGAFTFNPNGILAGGSTGNVEIVPSNSTLTTAKQTVCVNSTGRARTVSGSATCS